MGRKKVWWRSMLGGCLMKVEDVPSPEMKDGRQSPSSVTRMSCVDAEDLSSSLVGSRLCTFTVAELRAVTGNFSHSNLIGEGGFGPVYKGFVDDKIKPDMEPQAVAVKSLDLEGLQGHKEWLTEVIMLGQLRYPHLVRLIGYCYEDDHRLLVYELMSNRSLESHLFTRFQATLPWKTRIQIAIGAAKGLRFLHEADPPVIYRDLKASNILLDSDFHAKLSDFGLAKDGPQGDDTHVSTRVMGTHGYAAPEYIMTGHLTAKSDVYSFGVVLLELLTGRRSMDKKRPSREHSLVDWSKPFLNDPQKLSRIMDPGLEGQYSSKGAQRAACLAHMCLSYLPKHRPNMNAIVNALEPILDHDDIPLGTFVYTAMDADDCEVEDDRSAEARKEEENRKAKARQENDGGRRTPPRNQRRLSSPKSASYADAASYHRKSPRRHRGKGN